MATPKYTYGWLDKLTPLTPLTLPNGGSATHTYWPDGRSGGSAPPSPLSVPPV